MQHVLDEIYKINKVEVTHAKLNHSIKLFNKNRKLINQIYETHQEFPWRISADDMYQIIRAGLVIPVEEHNDILDIVYNYLQKDTGEPVDKVKVVVSGAFCEQPPIGLIKSIEMAGCYIVDDDFLLGSRWIEGDVDEDSDDPVNALAEAYLNRSTFSSSVYSVDNPQGDRLIQLVKKRKADGVIFATPSFCDPALLDAPIMHKACNDKNIKNISFQYHEDTSQFKVIKEQVGAFSDSIKLWEEPLENP
jgi:benzoyl-CoA reductase subunit C